jgi:hypothetical protein
MLGSDKDMIKMCLTTGEIVSLIGEGVSFAYWYLGNSMVGWNLVAHQPNPGHLVQAFIDKKRKEYIGTTNSHFFAAVNTVRRSESDSWILPPSEDDNENEPKPDRPFTIMEEEPINFLDSPTSSPCHLQKPREIPIINPIPTNAIPSFDSLNRSDYVSLALHIATNGKLPHQAIMAITSTDISTLTFEDNIDLYSEPLTSFTSPNFQPGRVILIGDAAHPISTASHGSVGASLSVCDAVVLSKLLKYAFSPNGSSKILSEAKLYTDPDNAILEYVGIEFDKLRFDVSMRHMNCARGVVVYKKPVKGLWTYFQTSVLGVMGWDQGIGFDEMQTLGEALGPDGCDWWV